NVTAGGAGSSISGGTGGIAVAGSVSVNQVLPVTEAYVSGAYLGLTGDATIKAVDNSEIWAIAGSGAQGGSVGFGVALAVNFLGSATNPSLTEAYLRNSTISISNGTLTVSAIDTNNGSDPRIIAITGSAGVGSGGSGSGIAGMISVNEIIGSTKAYLEGSFV